jgi:hypothetical protein
VSGWLGDDQTRWLNCPRCDEVVLEAQVGGLAARLSRFSVPLSHASILTDYGVCVFNIWRGMTKLFVRDWFSVEGRPSQGRLYVLHMCTIRR